MGEQILGGEVTRMTDFKDRPRDVGREKGQPQDTREIGARQPLTLRKLNEMFAAALGQLVACGRCRRSRPSSSRSKTSGSSFVITGSPTASSALRRRYRRALLLCLE